MWWFPSWTWDREARNPAAHPSSRWGRRWRFCLGGRSGGLWDLKKTSNPCKTACWQVKRKQKTTCKCKFPFGCWTFCSPWWWWFLIVMTPNHTQGPISVELFGDFFGVPFWLMVFMENLYKFYPNIFPNNPLLNLYYVQKSIAQQCPANRLAFLITSGCLQRSGRQ